MQLPSTHSFLALSYTPALLILEFCPFPVSVIAPQNEVAEINLLLCTFSPFPSGLSRCLQCPDPSPQTCAHPRIACRRGKVHFLPARGSGRGCEVQVSLCFPSSRCGIQAFLGYWRTWNWILEQWVSSALFLLKVNGFVKGVQNFFKLWGCVLWFVFACKDFSFLLHPICIEMQVFKIDHLKANMH